MAATPPPPISGGTLVASHDGARAIASDPDRDLVYVVDLATHAFQTIALQPGDEPGRLAEDGAGKVHVALRGAGAVVTIDPVAGSVTGRQAVCPAPRGVAWDASTDRVWVACATGELVALPAAGGAAVTSLVVERDLRDVFVNAGALAVTQFRSAQVLRVGADGSVTRRDALPAASPSFVPHVAWRAVAGPAGILATVHQEETTGTVTTGVQGGYGGCGGAVGPQPPPLLVPVEAGDDSPDLQNVSTVTDDDGGGTATTQVVSDGGLGPLGCTTVFGESPGLPAGFTVLPPGIVACFVDDIVRSDLTILGADGSVLLNMQVAGALPVDVALSADGSRVAVVTPGSTLAPGLPTVLEIGVCDQSVKLGTTVGVSGQSEPIAVAFDAANDLLVQSREPAELWVFGPGGGSTSIDFASGSRRDSGHDIFHVQAGGMIACASCHPEGGDDGHVWDLDGNARRTPSLRGTIVGTAPYHWPGDMKDMTTLIDDVYTVRMNGAALASDQLGALSRWVEAVPAPPAPSWVDAAAAARGKTLFETASVGCATCHSGPKLTNNTTVDVGTGGSFQVPPLVGVGWRTPLLHDGCAQTIADRFGSCATPGHGNVTALSAGDISDLGVYLETL
jgi:cytochrome c553